MRFESELLPGRLVRRYKRFFADVELCAGGTVVSHCPNPGSMRTCAVEGGRVWLREHDDPRRKLRYTWEIAEAGGALVCVNTGRANHVVAEALSAGAVAELAGFDELRREVKYGERSRVDFLLRHGERACYVEVKSVTMDGGGGVSAFPDSVTARGTRHLQELSAMVAAGHRAALLYCVNRTDATVVRPADDIDPVYGRALRAAAAAGVELLAYRADIDPARGIELGPRVPIAL
jgi:sugar fermentation stimulation protein A